MKILAQLLLSASFIVLATAQDATSKLKIRAVLHNPLNPYVELYVPGAAGVMERLNLAMEGLTTPQVAATPNGVLSFYSSATVDPAKPTANLAATVTVPQGVKQGIVLVLPAATGAKLPYQLMILNDSFAAFPAGGSRVINLTRLPLAIRAGEHALEVQPAKITAVPPVTKVNDLNQAQTSFYHKDGEQWVLISERPMQYTKDLRNIFLMFLMPNVEEPQIRTLIDTTTASQPVAAP